jgi:hypothetical protein
VTGRDRAEGVVGKPSFDELITEANAAPIIGWDSVGWMAGQPKSANFNVGIFRDRLLALHEQIERDGEFAAHATRFLIEAEKPGRI